MNLFIYSLLTSFQATLLTFLHCIWLKWAKAHLDHQLMLFQVKFHTSRFSLKIIYLPFLLNIYHLINFLRCIISTLKHKHRSLRSTFILVYVGRLPPRVRQLTPFLMQEHHLSATLMVALWGHGKFLQLPGDIPEQLPAIYWK